MSKKKLTTDEFNWIMEQVMAVADQPMPEMIFTEEELGLESDDLPGASSTLPAATAKGSTTLPPVSGTQPILIRVPKRVIRAFKIEAERTGGSYQTLMNRSLKATADGFV